MKRLSAIALLFFFFGVPVFAFALVGNPIPSHIPSVAKMEHALLTHIPPAIWPHVMSYGLWLVWLWLILGFIVHGVQQVLHIRPRRVPFLGVSQDIAAQILTTISSQPTSDPVAKTREARLWGVVPAPRDLTLDERAAAFYAERSNGRTARNLRRYRALPSDSLPAQYRNDPSQLWWIDTAVRDLVGSFTKRSLPPVHIEAIGVSDTVTVITDSYLEPPEPWQKLGKLWMLNVSGSTARKIATAARVVTDVPAQLIPSSIDGETVYWSPRGIRAADTDDPIPLRDVARWLALVPWLPDIRIITVGAWAEMEAVPAHEHYASQVALRQAIHGELNHRMMIVLSDEPCLPTGPFVRDDLIWLGQEWEPKRNILLPVDGEPGVARRANG